MPRVKRGVVRRQKRKKLSKLTKGYFQNKSKLYKFMKEASEKAGVYAYTGRKLKKRDYRGLFENSHDALMTMAPPDWRFTAGNSQTLQMFGAQDQADFVARSIADALRPHRKAWQKQLDEVGEHKKAEKDIDTAGERHQNPGS